MDKIKEQHINFLDTQFSINSGNIHTIFITMRQALFDEIAELNEEIKRLRIEIESLRKEPKKDTVK